MLTELQQNILTELQHNILPEPKSNVMFTEPQHTIILTEACYLGGLNLVRFIFICIYKILYS